MELQSFDLEMKHISGSKNIIADYFSRNNNIKSDLFCILHEELEKKVNENAEKD